MALTETQVTNQICDWFRANGINPADVPAVSHALIDNAGRLLTFRKTVRSASGAMVFDGHSPQYETVTEPVTVPPTPFVREWLRRGAPSPQQFTMELAGAEGLLNAAG